MELHREQPPPYVSTNPDELRLPSVPRHELNASLPPNDITLPGLQSVLAGIPERSAIAYDRNTQAHALSAEGLAAIGRQQPWTRGLPGIDASAFAGQFRTSTESAIMSPTETGSVMSADDTAHSSIRGGSLSLEDPDVRMAAEALSGLGNPDFARTKQPHRSHRVPSEVIGSATEVDKETQEPMLQLLIEAHPWVGGTINGSISAYATTKHYTPRIVQYGANLIERNMISTVSTVGRHTGVENGIRRYLNSRRPSDLERATGKRRKVSSPTEDDMEVDGLSEAGIDDMPARARYEYLPAYRNSKPPSYREEASPVDPQRLARPHHRSWSSKIMISSSALGVALSDASRRSLTYCVELLTRATHHIETVLNALGMVLRDYEQAQEDRERDRARFAKEVEVGLVSRSQAEHEETARRLADRIKQLCDDIWTTLKTVVHSVSTYAGGALPENARVLVRGQIMSIPRRWHLAGASVQHDEESQGAPSTTGAESVAVDVTTKAAHRMIVFAQEGLDVMSQVNGVCQITLQKAEEWLNTFGRRPPPPSTGAPTHSAEQAAHAGAGSSSSAAGQSQTPAKAQTTDGAAAQTQPRPDLVPDLVPDLIGSS